jgi:hypothetical protein
MSKTCAQRILTELKEIMLADLETANLAKSKEDLEEVKRILIITEQCYLEKTREARWQYNFEYSTLSSLQEEVSRLHSQIVALKLACESPTLKIERGEPSRMQKAHAKFTVALEQFDAQTRHLHEKVHASQIKYLEASDTAQRLITELQRLGNGYFSQEEPSRESTIKFKYCCNQAIKHAKPVLEQHQEWSIIFSNLVKTIANAFMYLLSAGNISNFFSVKRMEADLALSTFQKEITKEVWPLTTKSP